MIVVLFRLFLQKMKKEASNRWKILVVWDLINKLVISQQPRKVHFIINLDSRVELSI